MAELSRSITLNVNGTSHTLDVPVRYHLADVLRERLRLTGTHLGCEHGVCGACTVLVDGRSARSCLTLAIQVEGCNITTIEGVAGDGGLHPVQEAFRRHHALQCGFCTPGMVLTLIELLAQNSAPTEGQVRDAVSGNLCRCTGYQGIVDAALSVSRAANENGGSDARK